MLTKAKRYKLAVVLLCSLLISGSSNHANSIGFWQVLNAKANIIQNYWLFPDYFSLHLQQLPDIALASLARNKIPAAQYRYSLKLLKNNHTDTAKLFWQKNTHTMNESKRQALAMELLAQSQWGDLKLLAKQGLLPEGDALNHLKLQTTQPYSSLPTAFMQRLGFLSLSSEVKADEQCLFNVLMMSDHRSGLYKLAKLIKQYNKRPEPSAGVFCLSQPIYVGGAINCSSAANKMAQCDWQTARLKKQLPTDFDFIVMMPKQGSANVRSGIMQLNSKAGYQVFLHELMHFNGFEDEYALPKTKQAWLCAQSGFVAPNLFLANSEATPPVGWYKSQSCQQGAVAYKPSEAWSIMQYQQLALSAQYRALWQAHINTHFTVFPRFNSFMERSITPR
ncbi:hypothetical protein [Pseudoalteromonas sp. HL-AS2]|uniref:hypothetical protein n=1 Tax=Pseudoalteromonas sp. HL-AS2 TaxID=3071082 RepID=UPI0035C0645F